MKFKHRGQNGNMIVITVAVTAAILVPVLVFGTTIWVHFAHQQKAEDVVQAAVKVAAMDMSRIVQKDDNFGFVGLSNHPATGSRTVSSEGEKLPVVSIETWQRTLQQADKLADELQNDSLAALTRADRLALRMTVRDLNRTLDRTVQGDPRVDNFDANGKRVDIYGDVEKFLSQNLPDSVQLKSIQLTTGWVDDHYGYTLEAQPHLISDTKFRNADEQHLSTAARLECTFESRTQPGVEIKTASACQAYSANDETKPGTMNVRFSGRPVLGLLTWNEFLSNNSFRDNQVTNFTAQSGDFPVDHDARLQQKTVDEKELTSHKFAEHLYSWLRNSHAKVKTDAVLAMMNEPFRSYPNQIYNYQVTDEGAIARTAVDGASSRIGIVADGGTVSMADTKVKGGANAIIFFRDNVSNLDADTKHGGQPFQGLALDIEIGGTGDSSAPYDVSSVRARVANRRV